MREDDDASGPSILLRAAAEMIVDEAERDSHIDAAEALLGLIPTVDLETSVMGVGGEGEEPANEVGAGGPGPVNGEPDAGPSPGREAPPRALAPRCSACRGVTGASSSSSGHTLKPIASASLRWAVASVTRSHALLLVPLNSSSCGSTSGFSSAGSFSEKFLSFFWGGWKPLLAGSLRFHRTVGANLQHPP